MPLFDASLLDAPVEQVKEAGEIILDTALENPELTTIHEVVQNIVVDKQIILADMKGLLISKGPDCDNTQGDPKVKFGLTQKFWRPKGIGFRLPICEKELENFFDWGKAKGIDRDDVTQADFWNWMSTQLEAKIPEELIRILWFCDTTIGAVTGSPTGNLGDPDFIEYFNQIDGFFKKLIALSTTNPSLRVEIAANNTTSQKLGLQEAYDTLSAMVDNAPMRLMANRKRLKFYVTDSVYRAFKSYRRSRDLDNSFDLITIDQGKVSFDGIPLEVIQTWDETIELYFNDAGYKYLPHRAVLSYASNLQFGIESLETASEFRAHYDKTLLKVFVDMKARIDVQVIQDEHFMLAL